MVWVVWSHAAADCAREVGAALVSFFFMQWQKGIYGRLECETMGVFQLENTV